VRAKKGETRLMELRIDRLGGRGDGIADSAEGPVYVPLTAPGDIVEAKVEHADDYDLWAVRVPGA